MTAQMTWLFFMALTIMGAVGYNVAVKIAGDQINIFLFTVLLTSVAAAGHVAALVIYKYGFNNHDKMDVSATGVWMAVIAGVAVVAVDLGFFIAVKSGGMVLSQAVWTIGGLLFTAMIGIYFFKEGFDIYKAAGIVLGMSSLALLMKQN